MILATANLGRDVSPAEFASNLRRVLDAGGPNAVFAFQEIDEADRPLEMEILRRMVRATHRIVGGNTAVPVLTPHAWRGVRGQQIPACDGLAGFTPHRVINDVLIPLTSDLSIGVLNTHLPLDRPETKTRRREVRQALREGARGHAAGVWVADTNTRLGWPTIVKGERSVIAAGIDRARAWAPDGLRVVVTDRRTVPLTIDNHDAHFARIMWR